MPKIYFQMPTLLVANGKFLNCVDHNIGSLIGEKMTLHEIWSVGLYYKIFSSSEEGPLLAIN